MGLFTDIERQYIEARKKRDKFLTGVLSMLISELKYEVINKKKELENGDIIAFIQKTIKQKKEVMQEFLEAGRTDLSDKEKKEIKFLSTLLPPPLSDNEVLTITRQIINETGASGSGDMGNVIKEIMLRVKGRAEGGKVKSIVTEELNKKKF
jgi:hypothetical protein